MRLTGFGFYWVAVLCAAVDLVVFASPHVTAAGESSLPLAGVLAGAVLFIAASLQQVGLLYTTAAKAGFITGRNIDPGAYFRIAAEAHRRYRPGWGHLGVIGLICSVTMTSACHLAILRLQFIGALFWAIHILLIDHFSGHG